MTISNLAQTAAALPIPQLAACLRKNNFTGALA
jgi:hypothetical protein